MLTCNQVTSCYCLIEMIHMPALYYRTVISGIFTSKHLIDCILNTIIFFFKCYC